MNYKFKEQDLVRVIHSGNEGEICIGDVCIILDVLGTKLANVQAINENGEMKGIGTTSLNNLRIINEPQWLEAKKEYDKQVNVYVTEASKYNESRKGQPDKVANEFGISKRTIQRIKEKLFNIN